ncbi:type II toxin-antitoxin system RelE/ParE family toxin [Dyadobacter sp. CY343]|uniref:type II toxin-antitoxin system RelE family toxin n=1 Tax=Dyadobacter sp. CY343 TaxID=2907299 RepID=UPI001F2E1E53|nr:type II toxin-antitoxin system RelE/ParE family toxin [Dyadobacter sp. CY343]MCE7061293.1 type II toxin-antitoxin system RelE/ParE family toxin [Dyadobacter sp. CY343]
MKYEYARSFVKDTKKAPQEIRSQLQSLVAHVMSSEHISQLANVKKMKGYSNAYRIRMADYRIGFLLEDDVLIFTRLLHRKEIYRYFP